MSDELPDEPETERAESLARFSRITRLPEVARITQRGRDPETARYTFELADGGYVRAGTIKVLWSQAELGQVFAAACGIVIQPIKAADWRLVLAGLIEHCTDVEEIEGERFEDSVREWLDAYLGAVSVGHDRDGACAQGLPFEEDSQLHVSASHLAKYIRREFSENVNVGPLRTALTDLGYTRQTIMYRRAKKPASISYYVGARDSEPHDPR